MSETTQSASAEQENIRAMQELLNKAGEICTKNDAIHEEKQRRGEFFNTFTVLGLWCDEVRLHSPFIKGLLSTNGLHGCGNNFLVAFCKQIGTDFDCDGACVETERQFDYGRMDIVITQKDYKKVIVIENKIYADDQPSQLWRYKKYCDKYGEGNWTLLYLTIDGHDPSDESTKFHIGKRSYRQEDRKPYWRNISYKKDIETWLAECVQIAADKPRVVASIEQYLDVVKQLTNDFMEDEMAEDIITLLTEGNNLEIAESLIQWIADARFKILQEKIIPLLKERCGINDFGFGDYFGTRYSSFVLNKREWNEKYLCIYFEFQGTNWTNLVSGISYKKGMTPAKVVNNICEQLEYGEAWNKWWALWSWMPDEYRNWNGKTLCRIVANPDDFCKTINGLIERYTKIIDDALSSSAN